MSAVSQVFLLPSEWDRHWVHDRILGLGWINSRIDYHNVSFGHCR